MYKAQVLPVSITFKVCNLLLYIFALDGFKNYSLNIVEKKTQGKLDNLMICSVCAINTFKLKLPM